MNLQALIRVTLIRLDACCAGGSGLRTYRRWSAARLQSRISQQAQLTAFTVHHPRHSLDSFAKLCDRFGSDKGTRAPGPHVYGHAPHAYADFYASLFEHCRFAVRKVFEVGLGTNDPTIPSNMGLAGRPGASLRAWRDYFPNAHIYGADIDREILFTEQRITTFHVDQTSVASIATLWSHPDLHDFDLIIDDGLHTYEAGIGFFEQSHDRLRPGGVYVIEDVTPQSLERFVAYFHGSPHEVSYVTFRGDDDPGYLSSLVVVRRRATGTA